MYHNIGLKNPLVTKLIKLVMTMTHFHFFLPLNSHTPLLIILSKAISVCFQVLIKSIFTSISIVLFWRMFSIFQIYFQETFHENFFLENKYISYVFK